VSKSAPLAVRRWPSLVRVFAVTVLVLLAALALVSAAQAAITHVPDSSFHVKSPGKIGVDEEIGAVYIYAGGEGSYGIYKFDEEGNPWDFSATGTNKIDTEHIQGVPQYMTVYEVSVDNSGGPNNGDIYVGRSYFGESEKEGALVFSRTGDFLAATGKSSTKKKFGPTENAWPACGVTVDTKGDFYVSHPNGHFEYLPSYIDKYHPTGAWILGAIPEQEWPIAGTMGGPEHEPGIDQRNMCEIGVDNNGAIYMHSEYDGNRLRYYAPSKFGQDNPSFRVVNSNTTAFSVDQLTNEVYVAENVGYGVDNRIRRYDEKGNLLENFGEAEIGIYPYEIGGIGFNAASSRVYVSSGPYYEIDKVTIFKGVVTPDVEDVEAEADKTTATVSATLDPIGAGDITECELEYGTGTEPYSSAAPCSPNPSGAPFTSPEDVSVSLSGLEKETTYHYRFAVTNANGTTKDVDRTFKTHNVADVVTEGVTGVTKSDATLHGSFTGDGNATEYWFEWTTYKSPTEPEYEHQTSAQTTSNAGRVDVSGDIVGELTPYLPQNEPYHYRLVAKNSLGDITRGPDQTFHSLPPDPPTVSGTSASDVTESAAKLSAMIDPEEGPTVYAFEWGTSAALGSSTLVSAPIGEDSTAHPVESVIAGLQPGTTYHFRVVAINFGGTTYGPSGTFSTAGTSGAAGSGAAGGNAPAPGPTPSPAKPKPKPKPRLHCKKGFVKRHNRCVKKKHHRRHHHRRGSKRG
jgi:hypothetical protein